MFKTVYRSSCRDKHNCQRHDSNLDPLTPQSDALTTRLLRPADQTSPTRDPVLPWRVRGRVRPRTAVSVAEHCIPVSSADTRRHLRSANRHLLAVPRFRLNTYGRRAFSVAGPMAWNSLPDFIRHPTSSTDVIREPSTLGVYLKRILVRAMLVHPDSTLGALNDYALYKSTHSLSHSAFDTRLHTRPPQTNDVNRLAEIYSVNRFSHIGVKNCSSGGSCFLLIFLKTNVIFCKKA